MSSVLTRSSFAAASLFVAASAVLSGCGIAATVSGAQDPAPVQETTGGKHASDNGGALPGTVATDDASAPPEQSASPTESESADPAAERVVDKADQQQAPSASLPGAAYKGGGGPVPAGAADASSISEAADGSGRSVAVIESPSANLRCEIYSDGQSGCQVKEGDKPFPKDPATDKPANYISTSGGGVPDRQAVPDKSVLATGAGAQRLNYGQQVEYAGVVCASESNGMTCWDVESGHGAFVNRAEITGF